MSTNNQATLTSFFRRSPLSTVHQDDERPRGTVSVSPEEQFIQQRGKLRSSPRRKALTSNSPRLKVTEMVDLISDSPNDKSGWTPLRRAAQVDGIKRRLQMEEKASRMDLESEPQDESNEQDDEEFVPSKKKRRTKTKKTEQPNLHKRLSALSREQLAEIIEDLVKDHPELEQMKSLKEVFDGVTCASLPYTTAIKAVVCGVGEVKKYRNASGEQRQSVTIGLADSSMAVRGVLYDVSKMDTFKVGCTVMLLNSIIKKDAVRSIVLTNRSKILKTGPVAVSESLRKEALEMACPPPAEMVDIKAVHTSPVKTVLTIRGQVVSEEMDRTVKVNGEETTVRSIKLRDATGTCRISLWRDMAKVKTTVGSHLEITNAVVQFYNEEKSLSTTSRSKMEEIAVPSPDIGSLLENLELFKGNIYKSFPYSRWGSGRDAFCYRRVKTHLDSFVKSCIDQGRQLEVLESWRALIDYILKAWEFVHDLPNWDNPDHNKSKNRCFKALSGQCKRAISKSHLTQAEYKKILSRVEEAVEVDDNILPCVELIKKKSS